MAGLGAPVLLGAVTTLLALIPFGAPRQWVHIGNSGQNLPCNAPGSREILAMKLESAAKIKYGVWGLICGAIIAMIIGFGWVVGQPPALPKR